MFGRYIYSHQNSISIKTKSVDTYVDAAADADAILSARCLLSKNILYLNCINKHKVEMKWEISDIPLMH